MKISTKGRYGLHLLLDIAANGRQGRWVRLKDSAARLHLSEKYLEQIVQQLTKGGLLQSSRGPQGGYRLSRPPEEITAGEALQLLEGNLSLAPQEDDDCALAFLWLTMENAISQAAASITLSDLLQRQTWSDAPEYLI